MLWLILTPSIHPPLLQIQVLQETPYPQPTGHNSHWSPVLQASPQVLLPGVRWDATISSILLCPSTHKLESPSQLPNICLGLPLVHWIHKVTLTQPCVNIVANLFNGICWVLVYKKGKSSASNLIPWIQNLPVLYIKPWIKALDALKQLVRTCGYLIPDPECHFEWLREVKVCSNPVYRPFISVHSAQIMPVSSLYDRRSGCISAGVSWNTLPISSCMVF